MSRLVAVVPAAGLSRRMGRSKLTMPLGSGSVVSLVVGSLLHGGIDRALVVVRPPADLDFEQLQRDARSAGAEILVCDPPPEDMRASVEHALKSLEREELPPAGILLCPADCPGITPGLVRRVIMEFRARPRSIIIPEHNGKRGHPVALPWELALSIHSLPPGTGVNALHARHPDRRFELSVGDPAIFDDLDTPEDYRAWRDRLGGASAEP